MPLWLPGHTARVLGLPVWVRTSVAYTGARAWVWGVGGNFGNFVAPAAGGAIDGVCIYIGGGSNNHGYACTPGYPVAVEAGGAFSAGADLETLSDGRMVTRTTGRIVMRALEASGAAGAIGWASFRL